MTAGLGAALASCGSRRPPERPGEPVAAAALPHPRSGLWAWDSQANGERQLCLSGQVLAALAPRPGCPVSRQVRTASGAYEVETRCHDGPVGRTWARSRGDYGRAFSVDIAIDDARGGVSDHQHYRYLGPCAPGQPADDTP